MNSLIVVCLEIARNSIKTRLILCLKDLKQEEALNHQLTITDKKIRFTNLKYNQDQTSTIVSHQAREVVQTEILRKIELLINNLKINNQRLTISIVILLRNIIKSLIYKINSSILI